MLWQSILQNLLQFTPRERSSANSRDSNCEAGVETADRFLWINYSQTNFLNYKNHKNILA